MNGLWRSLNLDLGDQLNLANALLRSIETFFSVSNEYVDGGKAKRRREKKKQKEEDLDGELENVDSVAELRKRTEAKTSSYGKKFCSGVC